MGFEMFKMKRITKICVPILPLTYGILIFCDFRYGWKVGLYGSWRDGSQQILVGCCCKKGIWGVGQTICVPNRVRSLGARRGMMVGVVVVEIHGPQLLGVFSIG